MTTQTPDFKFNTQTNQVTIADNVKQSMLSGAYCPSEDINLDFLISSNVLGDATMTISIAVTGEASSGSSSGAFQGFVID